MASINENIGAPPGTLFYNGEERTDRIKITLIEYNESEYFEDVYYDLSDCLSHVKPNMVKWINVEAGKLPTVALNAPLPDPLVATLLASVGLAVVAHTIPRAVTVSPPLLVTLPAKTAEVLPMLVAAVDVTVGAAAAAAAVYGPSNCIMSPPLQLPLLTQVPTPKAGGLGDVLVVL